MSKKGDKLSPSMTTKKKAKANEEVKTDAPEFGNLLRRKIDFKQ